MSHTRHLILAPTVNCISPLGTGIYFKGLGQGRSGDHHYVVLFEKTNVLLKFDLTCLVCLTVCLFWG